MNTTSRLAPPSPQILLHVGLLTVPICLLVLGCKIQKLSGMEIELTAGDWYNALAPDVLFSLLYGIVWTGVLHLTRHWIRTLAAIVFSILSFALLFLGVAEQAFYLTTGTLLDGFILIHTAENLAMLHAVITSEMGLTTWALLIFLVLIALSPRLLRSWVARRPFGQISWQPNDWKRRPNTLFWGAVAILTAACALHTPDDLPDVIQPMQGNIYVNLFEQMQAHTDDDDLDSIVVPRVAPLRLKARDDVSKHNVVVVILESGRASSFNPYQKDQSITPFFAGLAERGRLVERAYSNMTHSSKALVSILCGVYPKIHNKVVEAAPGAVPSPCLARLLAGQGYATAFMQPAEENFERRSDLVTEFGYQDFLGKESLPSAGFHESSYFGWEDDVLVQPALDWIDEQQAAGKPFHLALFTLTAHHPYTVPKGFPKKQFSTDTMENDYLNTLAYSDRFLRKLWDGFEARGLADNTIFLITGDHGEGLGEHGRFQHDAVIYEEGIHVPMAILGPGIEKGGPAITGLRQHIDILPTVMDVLGYDTIGGALPGHTLLKEDGHEQLYVSCWYRNYCMARIDKQRKLIHHFNRRAPEVYDLNADPREKRNLKSSTDPAWIRDGIQELVQWQRQTNAQYQAQSKNRKQAFVTRTRPRVPYPAMAQLGDWVRLLGYDVEATSFAPGGRLLVTLYFEALEDIPPGWKLFTHLTGPTFRNVDHVPVDGAYPLSQWKKGDFVQDPVVITTRPSQKPGEYQLRIGLWNDQIKGGNMQQRAPITSVMGEQQVDEERRLEVLTITVEEPASSE